MLSYDDAINILKNLPLELVSHTFKYMQGIDMVHFRTDNFISGNDENYLIKSLDLIPDELNVWNYMKNSENKISNWCKILYYADINNMYYKKEYDKPNMQFLGAVFALPSNKEKRYIKKLYIGLYLNAGLDIYKAYQYLDIDIDKMCIMFDILKKNTHFNVEILYRAFKINKHIESNENYINYATKIKEIYDLTIPSNNYIHYDYLYNIINKFPLKAYQRFISLLQLNFRFTASYNLSNPTRNFSDDLIDKFKKLKAELDVNDDLLVSYIRNNNAIKNIRLFKSKNISSIGIENLLNLDKDFLDYIMKNNLIYDLDHNSWAKLKCIYINSNDLIKELFVKFTIKQQNNLRIKELSGDNSNDLLICYIKANIDFLYKFIYNYPNTHIKLYQFFQVYTELSSFQYNNFKEYIRYNNFEQALLLTYQVVEYH